MTLDEWIVQGEVGVSSQTIWSAAKGIYDPEGDMPYDPDDLRRCMLLVEAVPEARKGFSNLVSWYPSWGPFVREWDSLIAMLKEEMPTGYAPKTYKRMKQLQEES